MPALSLPQKKQSAGVDTILGVAVLTLSLSPFSLLSYAFTGAWIILLFLATAPPKYLPLPTLLVFLSLMVWLTLRFFNNIEAADPIEFSKSYFQFFTSALALLAIWSVTNRYYINLIYLGTIILLPTFIYTAIQVAELLIFGSTQSWFWLADYSITTATNADRFQAVNLLSYTRPVAQYHEPSYLALVAFAILLTLDKVISKYKSLLIFMGVATIIFSFSATVWILALGYYFIFYTSWRIKLVTCGPLIMLFLYYELAEFFRLSEIFVYGTSAWHRIGKPLHATMDAMHKFPLGVPLGNTDFVYDNSILVLMSYFGVLSVSIFAAVVFLFFAKKNYRKPLYFLVTAMMVNGAIITIESTLLVGMVFMLSRGVSKT